MKATPSVKTPPAKPWLWFVTIWLLSVGALGVVAWILRWIIRS